MTLQEAARALARLIEKARTVTPIAGVQIVVRYVDGSVTTLESDGFAAPSPEIDEDITKPLDDD